MPSLFEFDQEVSKNLGKVVRHCSGRMMLMIISGLEPFG
jgi:hypothetical protein